MIIATTKVQMLMYLYLLFSLSGSQVCGYSRPLFALTNISVDYFDLECIPPLEALLPSAARVHDYPKIDKLSVKFDVAKMKQDLKSKIWQEMTASSTTTEADPLAYSENRIHKFLFGPNIEDRKLLDQQYTKVPEPIKKLSINAMDMKHNMNLQMSINDMYADGGLLRAETFHNKVAVHMPPRELHYPGHCRLRESNDKMQTALNALAIFLYCSAKDIEKLPAFYVLRSARTIAMMKLAREKLAATWKVVKGDRKAIEIPHWTLEMYRPLFKYLDGREMARLNLSDPRILTFIGTHAELSRHQVGIIASQYVKITPDWLEAKNLNLMNNLLCGMPMNLMRKASSNVYLQLTQHLFYHIRACDSLQRSFYLNLMTKTEALGRSYSWSSRDVARLGLLLTELQGPDFAAINPKAMSGITAQVMLKIPPEVLQHVTETQLRYLSVKPLNILARKLKVFQDKQMTFGLSSDDHAVVSTCDLILILIFLAYLLLINNRGVNYV